MSLVNLGENDLWAEWIASAEVGKRCAKDDRSGWLSRGDLRDAASTLAGSFADRGAGLVFLFAQNDLATLIGLLAAWRAKMPVALLDPNMPADLIAGLVRSYRPEVVLGTIDVANISAKYQHVRDLNDGQMPIVRLLQEPWRGRIHTDLGILLSTSGSTGSPKFVRLSRTAVSINAHQIGDALAITTDDIGIVHLPVHYSYGLSVLTSHLFAGAAISLTRAQVTEPALWRRIKEDGGTHFPGVPFHYGVLDRLRINRTVPQCVMTFTQAGGHLNHQLRLRCHNAIADRGGRFYIMYGQTEAGPRITTLRSEEFLRHSTSVGKVLKGGKLSVENEIGEIQAPEIEGNVVYEGPNVMMGYAVTRDDLALPDTQKGRLETGDRGMLSKDGYLTLLGRTQRFAKIAGLRISLDDIESFFGLNEPIVAVAPDDKIILFVNETVVPIVAQLVPKLAVRMKLPSALFITKVVEAIPRTPSGKVDYKALERLQ